MAIASTSGASGYREKVITRGAVASAGILALSLVVVPPDVDGATAEERALRLAAVSLPAVTPWEAVLERLIGNQSLTVVPAAQMVSGAVNFRTPAMTTPLTLFRAEQPTGSPTQVISANDEPTVVAAVNSQALQNIALGPKIRQTLETAASVIVAGAFVVVFAIGIPVSFVLGQIYQLIDRIRGAPTELAASETLTPDVALNKSDPAALVADSADTPTVTERVTPTATTAETQKTSTDTSRSANDVTETAMADDASTGLTGTSGPELSASASTSESKKPTVRSATPRRVVRSPLGVREELRNLTQRVTGGHSTTRTADGGDRAAAAESSSAASSSAASSSAGGTSSGGDSSDSDSSGD